MSRRRRGEEIRSRCTCESNEELRSSVLDRHGKQLLVRLLPATMVHTKRGDLCSVLMEGCDQRGPHAEVNSRARMAEFHLHAISCFCDDRFHLHAISSARLEDGRFHLHAISSTALEEMADFICMPSAARDSKMADFICMPSAAHDSKMADFIRACHLQCNTGRDGRFHLHAISSA